MRALPATEPLLDVLEVLDRALRSGERLCASAVVEAARRSGATVFGILDRLEETGWLTGEQQRYELTSHGAVRARELLATYRD